MKIIITASPDADYRAVFNQFKEWCDLAFNVKWSIEIEGTGMRHTQEAREE